MSTFFGAIADDFTGATDLASLLARSGVEVSLRIGVPDHPPAQTAPLEIIALKCRTAPVEDAVAETLRALAWLKQAGAQRFFWKYCSTFDSTPRGNIGPVAEALMAALGKDQTIYCPAFPENGRAIFMGHLFVGDQLLSDSPMKDHPLTPMRDSSLVRLLAPQVTQLVGLVNRHVVAKGAEALRQTLAEHKSNGIAHVIVDCVAYDDLLTIADACQDMPLLTGGSAVAMPLPKLWLHRGLVPQRDGTQRRPVPQGPGLILSGSCSAMTQAQVKAYIATGHPAYKLDPLLLAKSGADAACEWLAQQPHGSTPLVYATAPPETVRAVQAELGTVAAGALVESALAACAVKACDLGYRRIVVAGGETSGAVAKALGISRLDIGPEIAPGVPWCFTKTNDQDVAITLKSGNFGTEAFFSRAFEVLAV